MLHSLTAKVKTVPEPVDYSAKFEAQRKWLHEQKLKQSERDRHSLLERGKEP